MKREIWIIDIKTDNGLGWQHYLEEYDHTRALQRLQDERDYSKRAERPDTKYRLTRYVPDRKSK